MPYHINRLTSQTLVDKSKKYFLDANIWLYLLNPSTERKNDWQKQYIEFVERLLMGNTTIVACPVVFAEVINRYINDVLYQEFIKNTPLPPNKAKGKFFKEDFRPSNTYKNGLDMLYNNLRVFDDNWELPEIEPSLSELFEPCYSMDFNDHYYILLAQKNNLVMVTHDGDMLAENIEILTLNATLLANN